MDISQTIAAIYDGILQLVPLFRVVWAVTAAVGVTMLIIAFVLKKNTERKKSPWIVGGLGLLMAISSGTQFIMSVFRR